jgi:hypothetical protein
VVPSWSLQRPARVALDVVAQGVARFAGLTDGFDVHVLAAAELAPAIAVVPDFAALDLDADDAGALDGDDEVDLVVLEVIAAALAGNDEIGGLKLLGQRLVDAALSTVGQARRCGRGGGHWLAGPTPSSETRMSNPPRSARFLRATSTMLSRLTPYSSAIAVSTSRTSAASSTTASVVRGGDPARLASGVETMCAAHIFRAVENRQRP